MLNYALLTDSLVFSAFITLLHGFTLLLSSHLIYLFNNLTKMKEILSWAYETIEMSFTMIIFI